MFKVGDRVTLRYDDTQANQGIIRKVVTVKVAPNMSQSPFWMTVEFEGEEYEVRGADCSPAK